MGRRADGAKRGEWVNRLARREASGLTVAEFCEWEGVSVAAFYNWQKKFTRESAEGQSPAKATRAVRSEPQPLRHKTAFLPVRVMTSNATASTASQIEIRLTNGVRIFVPRPDTSTLQDVITAASKLPAVPDDEPHRFESPHFGGMTEDSPC
jgi:hypothetical protein